MIKVSQLHLTTDIAEILCPGCQNYGKKFEDEPCDNCYISQYEPEKE